MPKKVVLIMGKWNQTNKHIAAATTITYVFFMVYINFIVSNNRNISTIDKVLMLGMKEENKRYYSYGYT